MGFFYKYYVLNVHILKYILQCIMLNKGRERTIDNNYPLNDTSLKYIDT